MVCLNYTIAKVDVPQGCTLLKSQKDIYAGGDVTGRFRLV